MKKLSFLMIFFAGLFPNAKSQSPNSLARPYIFETAFLNDSKQNDTNFTKFLAIDLGLLKIESGKLIVCDPVQVHNAQPITYDFPKGSFPIQLAFSYVDSIEIESLHYVSYCRVKFSNAPVHQWILTPYSQGRKTLPGTSNPIYQYTAFSESGIILDQNARNDLIKWSFSRWASFFVDTLNNSSILNSWKLKTFGKNNLAAFSGFDTTTFKVYIGLDANKKICRLLIDTGMFQLHPSNF